MGTLVEPGVKQPALLHTWGRQYTVAPRAAGEREVRVVLPPLSCALLIEA